jgi:hypothetical protein
MKLRGYAAEAWAIESAPGAGFPRQAARRALIFLVLVLGLVLRLLLFNAFDLFK